MSTADEQARRMREFHEMREDLPPRSLESWHALEAGWKARQSIEIVVGELRQLLARLERAEAKLADCERWALKNPNGDMLRRVLYPSTMPPAATGAEEDICAFCERPLQPYAPCFCAL